MLISLDGGRCRSEFEAPVGVRNCIDDQGSPGEGSSDSVPIPSLLNGVSHDLYLTRALKVALNIFSYVARGRAESCLARASMHSSRTGTSLDLGWQLEAVAASKFTGSTKRLVQLRITLSERLISFIRTSFI